MKNTYLSSKLAATVLALGALTLGVQAIPTNITGGISFSGTAVIDTTNLATATKFISFQDVTVATATGLSGDYNGTHDAQVTVTPFTFSPATASTPILPLWTFVFGTTTYSYDLSSLHVDFVSPTGILLSGLGTAHISGPGIEKLDTSGRFDFSAQTIGLSSFTFSATTTVPAPSVPDGGSSAAMLGASLCGLVFLKRKQTVKAC